MREILFRGKRVDNGELVEGHFLISQKSDKTWYIIADILASELMAIVPESLSQFSGLLDKNGKRIFEGDLIKSKCGGSSVCEIPEIFEVSFREGSLFKKYIESCGWEKSGILHKSYAEQSEIIGNIHDSLNNPTPH